MKEWRWLRNGGQLNFTLKTAYSKFWIYNRGVGQLFTFEVQSMTMWTFNIHRAQRMPCGGRFLVWTAGNWKSSQGLVISHNLLNMFNFMLLNDPLLLSHINLM